MAVLDYQKIYEAASKRYHIPASVLAGDVQVESGGDVNARSPVGAFGLTQFMPATAKSYGVRPGDPTSEIMGQAHYLADLGYSKNPKLALSSYNAGPGNPGAAGSYADKVLAAAKAYASLDRGGMMPGGGGAPTSLRQAGMVNANFGSPYTAPTLPPNVFDALSGVEQTRQELIDRHRGSATLSDPVQQGWDALSNLFNGQKSAEAQKQAAIAGLRQVPAISPQPTAMAPGHGDVNPLQHFTIGRTDMGVDANARVGTPILAPNDSKVVHIYPSWYKGQPYLLMQLTSGPNRGKYYYVSEQIANLAKPGTTVKRGQPIATYAPSGTGIEIGWGTPGPSTEAQATTGYSEGQQTRSGKNFRNYLHSLGAG